MNELNKKINWNNYHNEQNDDATAREAVIEVTKAIHVKTYMCGDNKVDWVIDNSDHCKDKHIIYSHLKVTV